MLEHLMVFYLSSPQNFTTEKTIAYGARKISHYAIMLILILGPMAEEEADQGTEKGSQTCEVGS